MSDVILVHGGFCGGWCWELFEPELQRLGHRTHSVDLPIEDPEASLEDYASAVVDVAQGIEHPWLVGHSMGGLVVPRVALRRPVAGLVFLCAGFPPRNEAEFQEDLAARAPRDPAHVELDAQGRNRLSFEGAAHDFFNDCPLELQRWAHSRLRAQATGPAARYAPIPSYPDVPLHAIVTTEDRIVLRDKHTALIRRRIEVEPVVLPGGHFPLLSRPRQLAEVVHAMMLQSPLAASRFLAV